MIELSAFMADLAYFAAVIFSDVFKLLAASFIGASFLYGLVIGTVFILRNI